MADEYVLDPSANDIGEAVSMIRVQYFKMHAAPFAEKIGVREKLLLEVEDGRSPHGMMVLKKIAKTFKRVKVKLNIEIEQ